MHIKFEHVQAVDGKVKCQTSRKYFKNFNQKEITYRLYEVQLWFFHTALYYCNKHKCQVSSQSDEITKLCSGLRTILIQGQITPLFLVLITPIIELVQDLRVIYILTNLGTNLLIFVDATVYTKSNIEIF